MPRSRWFLVLFAGVTNIGVLLLPCFVVGWPTENDLPRLLMFLCLATLFCVGDALAPDNFFAPPNSVPSSTPDEARQRTLALATGMTLLAIFWLTVVAIAQHGSSPLWPIGGCAMLTGVLLRWAAIRTLGRQFRTEISIPADHQLIVTGVYRWLRHPSEFGLLLISAGAGAFAGSWIGLLLTVGLLYPLMRLRLRCEEAELIAAWGEQYSR